MTPENFCYWLRGFIELGGTIEAKHFDTINKHLNLVFENVTMPEASVNKSDPAITQSTMKEIKKEMWAMQKGHNRKMC